MDLKHILVQWLSENLERQGFKSIKSLPSLNIVKEWLDARGQQVGVFQVFINHDGFLNIYINNLQRGVTCVFTYPELIDAAKYQELSTYTEEEVNEILKQSKKDSLNEKKFLNEKQRLSNILKRKSISDQKTFEELVDIFEDKSATINKAEEFSVQGVGVLKGDFLLANEDKSGVLVADQFGWNAVVGNNQQYFNICNNPESKWIFFTQKPYLMERLAQITKSKVIFYQNTQNLNELLAWNNNALNCAVLIDVNQDVEPQAKLISIAPAGAYNSWDEYLEEEAENIEIQKHLRNVMTEKKSAT